MKASIIVPAFNSEKTLKHCLYSLVNQKYNDEYQIIIVNDGSTDKTEELAKQYCDKYSNVKLISQKNKGVCEARNIGIKHSRGEIIVNMDSDCIASQNWLSELVKPFTKEEVGVVSSYGGFGGTSTAFRRSVLKKVGLYDTKFYYYREDTDITFRVMEAGFEFKRLPQNFEHIHPEVVPKGFRDLIDYGINRMLLHANDALLWKKHKNKRCADFLRVKHGFLVDPWWDFSIATGLWGEGGKMGLSSPRFNSPYNKKSTVFVKCDGFKSFFLTILGGFGWMFAVKFGRLVGSIQFRTLLI